MGVPEGIAGGIEDDGSADAGEWMAVGQIVSQAGTVRSGHAQRLSHQVHGIVRLHRCETWPSADLRTIAFLESRRLTGRCARGRSRYPSALRKCVRGGCPTIGKVKRIACNGRGGLSAQI